MMKRNSIHILLFHLVLVLLAGCNPDETVKGHDDDSYLSLFIQASSINEDQQLWEDRVDELRMLVFNTDNGGLIYNEILYFPNGFDQRCRAVRLSPGTYNFYFIANETVYEGDFDSALLEITNESDFMTDSRFASLTYNTGFVPDQTSSAGRFVMSAIYKNIPITAGGTETNPLLLPLPTEKVELIRNMAKVEVIFRKKVSGSTIPDNTITSVLLENVPDLLSVPPIESYYTGSLIDTPFANLSGLDYSNDSIGRLVFYIPERLIPDNNTVYTLLEINNQGFPIETDAGLIGITEQRRTIPSSSQYSVIRNYHYQINAYIDAEGGVTIETHVQPWQKNTYTYIFQGDQQITIPPVLPTDSSIIITTECGKVEILSHNEGLQLGLQGAYNDVVDYYDPVIQGPTIIKGSPPFYCESKYGDGWRLINSCELLSFLAVCDIAYNVWTSNTWEADTYNMPYYSRYFRLQAQQLLENLTGYDLSGSTLYDVNNFGDALVSMDDLGLLNKYFTPGDIMVKEDDFPNGWPYSSDPGTDLTWFYNEVTIQVKAYWYGDTYLSPSIRTNWDTILYHEFERYDYSSTISRCVRTVE